MKTTFKFLKVLALILPLTFTAFAQQTHTITLKVQTNEIKNPNLNDFCNFGQTDGVSNVDFTVLVKDGDIVVWKGVSIDAPDTDEVEIVSINHRGGASLFGKNVLRAGRGQTTVQGTVQGSDGSIEKYSISFRVKNNGRKRNGMFVIDPKIQVRN